MPVTINGSNTPTAGGVVYGDGTNYASTSAGTSGQALLSGGAGAPTWGTPASATTATNLAGGAQGSVPYQSAAGTTALLAAGTSGQVLTTQGAGANPTWTTPSGGSWTYLTTLTASSSATLDYSGFSTTYDVYAVVIASLVPATTGVAIRCNPYNVSGGAETNNLYAALGYADGAQTFVNGQTGSNVNIGTSVLNTGTYRGVSGIVYFANPKGSTGYMQFWFQTASTSNTSNYGQFIVGGGRAASNLQYDGFRIQASSGNLASGSVRVYGIKNS